MSYSGKQSNEVGPGNPPILHLYCRRKISQVCSSLISVNVPEMAGYRKGSEVPPEAAPPKHRRVPRLLPERAHSMGECERGRLRTCVAFMTCVIMYTSQGVNAVTLFLMAHKISHISLCIYCHMTLDVCVGRN